MSKTFLVNIDTMEVLKAVNGGDKDAVTKMEFWADILIPRSEFYICGGGHNSLKLWSADEMRLLHSNTTGTDLKIPDRDSDLEYCRLLENMAKMLDMFPLDTTTLEELEAKLGRPLKQPNFKPQKEKAGNKASKGVSGGDKLITRPKEGTASSQVWDAADYYYKKLESKYSYDAPELRETIIDACVKYGINKATATTQFSRWKKHRQQS